MEMAFSGEVSLFISDAILQETLRVLRDKFGLSKERLARAERYLDTCATRVKPSSEIYAIKEDPDDNRVLECAEAAGCQYNITGDLDLLRLGTTERFGLSRCDRSWMNEVSERATGRRVFAGDASVAGHCNLAVCGLPSHC